MLFNLFTILTLTSLKKPGLSELIDHADLETKQLKRLFLAKTFFLITLTVNIFKPAALYLFGFSPQEGILIDFDLQWLTSLDSKQFFDFILTNNFDFSLNQLITPALLITFFILEYDLVILPFGYRSFAATSNPLWRTGKGKDQRNSDDHVQNTAMNNHPPAKNKAKNGPQTDNGADPYFAVKTRYIKYTFFWLIFYTWLPIITIRINLGFDTLDYRRVVEAMLLGLKRAFHHQFLSFSSIFANLLRIVVFLVFCFLSSTLGAIWFGEAKEHRPGNTTTNDFYAVGDHPQNQFFWYRV